MAEKIKAGDSVRIPLSRGNTTIGTVIGVDHERVTVRYLGGLSFKTGSFQQYTSTFRLSEVERYEPRTA